MLQLRESQANTITVTVTEKQTLSSPYYLIRFISEGQNVENSCIVTDSSSYPQRFNQFTVTESTTENRTAGTLTLVEGIHEYRIYEQSSPTNLDWNNSTTLLEIGLAKVIGTQQDSIVTPTYSETFVWQTS